MPQIPFYLRRKSITTDYLMTAYSQAQQIDFPALSSCLHCPSAFAVNVSNLIHVIYKADIILLKDLIKY